MFNRKHFFHRLLKLNMLFVVFFFSSEGTVMLQSYFKYKTTSGSCVFLLRLCDFFFKLLLRL